MPNPEHQRHLHRIYESSIRRLYVDSGYSIRRIESILHSDYGIHINKNAIRDILLRLGVDTSRSSGSRRSTICACCGSQTERVRSRYRHSIGRGATPHAPWRTFCDWLCFSVWKEEHCAGQREARRVVESITPTPLPEDAVVHFIDGDTRNTHKRNIRVFTSTERHMREHRVMSKEE
jgi:hypothetical protein